MSAGGVFPKAILYCRMVREKATTIRAGVFYGLAAYATWGVAPVYFKTIATVPPLEVLMHRIVWSVVFLILLTAIRNRWHDLRKAFRTRKVILYLIASTILVAGNWFTFIWAITNERVLQASLGYYINPLVSIVLGMVFLKEKLSKWGIVAVLLALVGVVYQIVQTGTLPAVALILAFSFGLYGLVRKVAGVGAVTGLTVETILLFPLGLAYLIFLGIDGSGSFGTVSWRLTGLLCFAGIITSVPLLWFAKAARRLHLQTVGFLQYIAPSLQFIMALLFGETFTMHHAVTFGIIWTALIIYSVDSYRSK